MDKKEIAEVLQEIATLLELKGENPFKVRAYANGARIVDSLTDSLDDLVSRDQLSSIKGIGEALAKKIQILHETGSLPFFDELKASLPAGVLEILEVPGLGAKKARVLFQELGIDSIESLARACERKEVQSLPGFGEKTEEKILSGIKNRQAYAKRHLWWEAEAVALPILEGLQKLPGVQNASTAGSLRRGLETVGDLDFVVASTDPEPVMDWFVGLEQVQEVTAKGSTKSSIRLKGGMQADLRVVPPHLFGYALHHFTGSKDHNVQMRQRALSRGLSLSEWGLSPVEPSDSPAKEMPAAPGEMEVFAALGLQYIPPEAREGLSEVSQAESSDWPALVDVTDLRGAFHNHTTASDGRHSLEDMAGAASAMGWEYLGIADHSKASFQANGLTSERLLQQVESIRKLNASGTYPVHLFSGVECDILGDGSLDLETDVLRLLDYVVVSIHSGFQQSEEVLTSRLVRAIEHPCTTMVGHPTGRLLLMREGYKINLAKVIDAAAANGVMIELNAHPRRLDMDWRWWARAREKGVLCAINPDAHDKHDLSFVAAGIKAARKAGLQPRDVFNTRTLQEIQSCLSSRK